MRVLLLGAGGMLARDLVHQAPPGAALVPLTRRDVDATDDAAVSRAVADTRPGLIINCAAYTNVDRAEAEPEQAFAVNGQAPGIIGQAASRTAHRSPLTPLVVHFSTDYVFDGRGRRPYREEDPTGPLGIYGASKLAGERALAQSGARYLIVRTSWLFGAQGRSFPRTMWERAAAGQATRVVTDQTGRPTYTVDLARAVWEVVSGEREGGSGTAATALPLILHVANTGEATWYDVARRVFEAARAPALLSPCATADYATAAKRPGYSVLDTSRYEALAGHPLPMWEAAVDRFLTELAGDAPLPLTAHRSP